MQRYTNVQIHVSQTLFVQISSSRFVPADGQRAQTSAVISPLFTANNGLGVPRERQFEAFSRVSMVTLQHYARLAFFDKPPQLHLRSIITSQMFLQETQAHICLKRVSKPQNERLSLCCVCVCCVRAAVGHYKYSSVLFHKDIRASDSYRADADFSVSGEKLIGFQSYIKINLFMIA